MKITKNSFSEKNFKKTIDLVQLDLVQNRKICGDTGNLRVEYQPQMITEIFARTHASEASSGKIHIGCGGGKTTIVLAARCLAIEHGFAKKLVVTAPTIALTVQI